MCTSRLQNQHFASVCLSICLSVFAFLLLLLLLRVLTKSLPDLQDIGIPVSHTDRRIVLEETGGREEKTKEKIQMKPKLQSYREMKKGRKEGKKQSLQMKCS
jgi:hypothetical protein